MLSSLPMQQYYNILRLSKCKLYHPSESNLVRAWPQESQIWQSMGTIHLNEINLARVDTFQQIPLGFIFPEGKFSCQACETQQREDAESGQSIWLFSSFCDAAQPKHQEPPSDTH